MQQTEKKLRHPPYHYAVINRLTRYKPNCDRIVYIKKELAMMGVKTTVTYSDMPHGSGTSDSTGDLASRISDKKRELLQLQNEVELIYLAVSMLPDVTRLIITERYLNDNKEAYVQFVLKKNHGLRSRDSYYRLKDEAVGELARMMGEVVDNG